MAILGGSGADQTTSGDYSRSPDHGRVLLVEKPLLTPHTRVRSFFPKASPFSHADSQVVGPFSHYCLCDLVLSCIQLHQNAFTYCGGLFLLSVQEVFLNSRIFRSGRHCWIFFTSLLFVPI